MNMGRFCLNWKLIAGVGIVALAVVVVAPNLAWAAIPFLFILICPLMMLVMMRGMGSMGPDRNATSTTGETPLSIPEGTREERLAALKARNDALAREIAPLEDEDAVPQVPSLAGGPKGPISRNGTNATA